MVCFVNSAVAFFALILSVTCNKYANISITPSEQPLIWKTDLKIECLWKATDRFCDIWVGTYSAWSHPQYSAMVQAEDNTQRVYWDMDEQHIGRTTLYIKDITRADEHTFTCFVSQNGASESISINVLEPPSSSVTGLTAVPDFNAVTITFDPVDEATVYTVGIQTGQTTDWTETETSELTHTFTGLEIATEYTVRVLPGNAAGYRPGVETETVTVTKDNYMFSLEDRSGQNYIGNELALLIHNGGTVCDDNFDKNAANAICKAMGYCEAQYWTSAAVRHRGSPKWSRKHFKYDINLDDIKCAKGADWPQCTYSTTHNCYHREDVLLSCTG